MPARAFQRPLSIALLVLMLAIPAAGTTQDEETPGPPEAALFEALQWRNIGPAISSGRIVDIDVDPRDHDVVYAAAASGGVWKTVNRGTTWQPVFEREGTISIGAIAVAPSNPNVVWVGTGEANNQRSSSWGDGVYRSRDGGKTWQHMGLRESQHVGGFAIDPNDENVVYVAALGALWGPNEERGLFKSTDGGATWDKVLFLGDNTGVVDVVMDPRDPDRLYAAAYQRERRNWSFLGGGPEGGIYRTEDGGASWQKLENGLPDPDIGKIGFAMFPGNPDIVYAIVEAQDRQQTGIYVTHDRGASWEHRSTNNPTAWYYSQIRVDPQDPERLYVLGTRVSVSDDGGRTFRNDGAPGIHVDHHALWIDPDNPSRMIIGNDGGIAFSYDRGATWDFAANLPVTQYYHIAVDMQEPFYYVYGGTQDNNTWGGPSGTRNSDGIVNDDWYITVGGDGFYAQIDPADPTIVYSESQYGGLVRFDTTTGERKRIQPQPPEGESNRWNWSAPLLISPHDNNLIYFAANKVFRSDNRGDVWEVISDDLTRQMDRDELPMMGRNWPSDAVSRHSGVSEYGNITSFDESPRVRGLLAVGTDDGLVQISEDGGGAWRRIDGVEGVPELTRVSRLMWSRHADGRLYVAFDGHKDNNFLPYVLVSEDRGATWANISSDLPEFGSTRVIREHPRNPDLLATGTEFGVFVSIDRGGHWVHLNNNLPTTAVHDIVFHPRDNDLVIGTHGRGIWILDDIAILEELAAARRVGVHLASVRPATQFNNFNRGRGSQGARYFRAPNPPRGAILTYYVGDQARGSAGEDSGEAGASDRGDGAGEQQGSRGGAAHGPRLEVFDNDGKLVQRLQLASAAGLHRTLWDLRHEPPYRADPAQNQGGFGGFFGGGAPRGPLVMPGIYTARLTVGDLVSERQVEVRPDPLVQMSQADRHARHDALLRIAELQATAHAAQRTAEQLRDQMQAVDRALGATTGVPDELHQQARELTRAARSLLTDIQGARGFPPDPSVPPGITRLLNQASGSISGFTAAPNDTERAAIGEAETRLESVVEQLAGC